MLLKITTDGHEASHGLSVTAELLVNNTERACPVYRMFQSLMFKEHEDRPIVSVTV